MKPVQENQQKYCNKLLWAPIAQFSVSEDTRDEKIETVIVAAMFQTIPQLELPDEQLSKITKSITETARKARQQCSSETSNSLVQIHLFCQRETPQHSLYWGENQISRGWGYYVIDKCGSSAITSSERQERIVELYIYKEGE